MQNLKENVKLLFVRTWQLRGMNMKAQDSRKHQCKTATYLLLTTNKKMLVFVVQFQFISLHVKTHLVVRKLIYWHVWNFPEGNFPPFSTLSSNWTPQWDENGACLLELCCLHWSPKYSFTTVIFLVSSVSQLQSAMTRSCYESAVVWHFFSYRLWQKTYLWCLQELQQHQGFGHTNQRRIEFLRPAGIQFQIMNKNV